MEENRETFNLAEFIKPEPKPKIKLKKKKQGMRLLTKIKIGLAIAVVLVSVSLYAMEQYAKWRQSNVLQFPIAWIGFVRKLETEKVLTTTGNSQSEPKTEAVKLPSKQWAGIASYYSEDGCIGCDSNLIMANGERLDDDRLTLAFNDLPMNTEVRITNVKNGKSTMARVTDTGGFNSLGRIADLSVATKKAIDCNDLCEVLIEFY